MSAPTPRTDAAWAASFSPEKANFSVLDLARTLERELATERARLDSGTILLIVAGERVWHCGVDLRAAIDAGMREDAK